MKARYIQIYMFIATTLYILQTSAA